MPPKLADTGHITTSTQRKRLLDAQANAKALEKDRKATDVRVEQLQDERE